MKRLSLLFTTHFIDDTDLPKTGRKMEWIGYIFSHVSGSYMLGFKGLFLSFFDGSSFFPWDMSLHVEMGRNKKKPQEIALSNQQQKQQNITNNAITTKK